MAEGLVAGPFFGSSLCLIGEHGHVCYRGHLAAPRILLQFSLPRRMLPRPAAASSACEFCKQEPPPILPFAGAPNTTSGGFLCPCRSTPEATGAIAAPLPRPESPPRLCPPASQRRPLQVVIVNTPKRKWLDGRERAVVGFSGFFVVAVVLVFLS